MRTKMQIGAVLLSLFAATVIQAGIPLPAVSYYGALRDAYGFPYTDSAEIWLMRGTNEVVRYKIEGVRAAGVNYQLDVMIDNGSGERYIPQAVRTGEELEVFARYNGAMLDITPTNNLIVPAAGETLLLNFSSGTDSDGDGLPDEWEQMLIENSGGALTSLADVTPDGDFDGDGASNLTEYLSGTFPFLANDRLALDELKTTAGGRVEFKFFAVAGFSYKIETVDDLRKKSWSNLKCAVSAEGDMLERIIVGRDDFQTIYFEVEGDSAFVRLTVE